MTKREIYAAYGVLAVFALGLLFHGMSRYRFYQNYIDISPPAQKYYETDRTTDSDSLEDYPSPSDENIEGDDVQLIDINSATLQDLVKLPGIGKVTALNIIDYRTAHGSFESVDELIEVKGIGQKKLEMLKHYVNIR